MVLWGEETQLWIKNDELGAHARVKEALFMITCVVCAACEAKVLAARQTRRDDDERHCRRFDIFWNILAFNRVSSKLVWLGNVVCQALGCVVVSSEEDMVRTELYQRTKTTSFAPSVTLPAPIVTTQSAADARHSCAILNISLQGV
jgi:hypothetical protein